MNSESSVFILSLLPQLVPMARITSRQPGVEGYYWRTFHWIQGGFVQSEARHSKEHNKEAFVRSKVK